MIQDDKKAFYHCLILRNGLRIAGLKERDQVQRSYLTRGKCMQCQTPECHQAYHCAGIKTPTAIQVYLTEYYASAKVLCCLNPLAQNCTPNL